MLSYTVLLVTVLLIGNVFSEDEPNITKIVTNILENDDFNKVRIPIVNDKGVEAVTQPPVRRRRGAYPFFPSGSGSGSTGNGCVYPLCGQQNYNNNPSGSSNSGGYILNVDSYYPAGSSNTGQYGYYGSNGGSQYNNQGGMGTSGYGGIGIMTYGPGSYGPSNGGQANYPQNTNCGNNCGTGSYGKTTGGQSYNSQNYNCGNNCDTGSYGQTTGGQTYNSQYSNGQVVGSQSNSRQNGVYYTGSVNNNGYNNGGVGQINVNYNQFINFIQCFTSGQVTQQQTTLVHDYYRPGSFNNALIYFQALPLNNVVVSGNTYTGTYQSQQYTYVVSLCKSCYGGYAGIRVQCTSPPYSYIYRRFIFVPAFNPVKYQSTGCISNC